MDKLLLQKMAYRLLEHSLDAFELWWESRGQPQETERHAHLNTAAATWKYFKRRHADSFQER